MKLYTSKVVASWLGLTERRVRQLRDEGIIQEARPGLYELQPTVRRYIQYLRGGAGGDKLNEERAGLLEIKRKKAQIELDELEGGLHRTEDIERAMGAMLSNFRTRMLAIPAKTAGDISRMKDQAEIFDRLKMEVDEALDELSNYDAAFAEEEGGAQEKQGDAEQEV